MIRASDLQLTHNVRWTGRTLITRIGFPLKCIKNVGNFKVFVEKTQSMDGRSNDNLYYIVDTKTRQVYVYTGYIKNNVATEVVRFLTSTNIQNTYYSY